MLIPYMPCTNNLRAMGLASSSTSSLLPPVSATLANSASCSLYVCSSPNETEWQAVPREDFRRKSVTVPAFEYRAKSSASEQHKRDMVAEKRQRAVLNVLSVEVEPLWRRYVWFWGCEVRTSDKIGYTTETLIPPSTIRSTLYKSKRTQRARSASSSAPGRWSCQRIHDLLCDQDTTGLGGPCARKLLVTWISVTLASCWV